MRFSSHFLLLSTIDGLVLQCTAFSLIHPRTPLSKHRSQECSSLLASSPDDGWENDESLDDVRIEKNSKLETLEELRTERSPATSDSKNDIRAEPERDLFIPIFVGVAITGFVGAYAYESLRLYARGELYLPF